jgi:MFS superfamily sulfate permease-like transporter
MSQSGMKFPSPLPIFKADHRLRGGLTLSYGDVRKLGAPARKSDQDALRSSAELVIDVDKRMVVVRFARRLTFDDIRRYAERLRSNPAFRPKYSEIVDLTEVEEIDLNASEFLRLADEIDPFAPEAKRAFVVRNATQKHAARMHKVLRTQRNIEIFESIEEAERWISM